MNVDAIILARGGSKGLPGKNIIDFCGKPLLSWTLEQCQQSVCGENIWLSSDSEEILEVASAYGAQPIKRPDEMSGDMADCESAWIHAIDHIEMNSRQVDIVVAPQVTSPLRESSDIDKGVRKFVDNEYDSMFSSSVAEDLFIWVENKDEQLESSTYDYENRGRRQDLHKQYIENGSFYIFKPNILKEFRNRLGGKIGYVEMEFWKMFEIDVASDLRMCAVLMQEYLLGEG